MSKKITEKLITIRDCINFAEGQFKTVSIYFGHGTDNARDEACYLVLSILCLPCDVDLDTELTTAEQQIVIRAIQRRIQKRVPTAYLTQEAWFAGMPFYVDERVIIPRSPLAELIQNYFAPWIKPEKVKRILDIGTGSGCIAISCAYAFPQAQVDAVDTSEAALEVARINCVKHDVQHRVRLLKSDLFSTVQDETYDIIISNPPYVSCTEMQTLPQEYLHEPQCALLAGERGDEIIARIIATAAKHLTAQGILVVEVGNSESEVLQKYPTLPFIWLEFTAGEGEVFLLMASDLK